MSGWARTVSSVTYITGRPWSTAYFTASSVWRSMVSSVQFSAYWRIGEEPMNVHTSIGSPTFCEISITGVMSWISVRAAQLARMRSPASRISCARRLTSRTTCGPAPGSPMSAVSIPSRSIKCRISILSSIPGV